MPPSDLFIALITVLLFLPAVVVVYHIINGLFGKRSKSKTKAE